MPPEHDNIDADGALDAGGQEAYGAQQHAFPSPSVPSTTPGDLDALIDLGNDGATALRCVARGSVRRVARPPHPAGGRGGGRPRAISRRASPW
jgi:hypothetical protein